MILEICIALISLVLGWYGRDWIAYARKRTRDKEIESLFRKDRELALTANRWIVDYYAERGATQFLFKLNNGMQIPFLTKPAWYGEGLKGYEIQFAETLRRSSVTINKKSINNREAMGQNIWDAEILCLDKIEEDEKRIVISFGRCTYFQYATIADKLMDETYECVRNRKKKAVFRENNAGCLQNLQTGNLDAQNLGMGVAVVLNLEGRHKILIQKRSMKTGIARDLYALIPSTTLEPVDYRNLKLSIPLHVFLAEFYEELYDHEELIHNTEYLAPDWFYNKSPVEEVS